MAYFIRHGNNFSVTDKDSLDLHEKLPVGNYVVKFSMMEGFYLEKINNFVLPAKIYGDTTRNMDRIINTFLIRDNSTGVLLEGEKGSGKTLLAKALAVKLAEEYKMPTIMVNQAYGGDGFNKFIQSIDQPMMMLFDEFEKVYRGDLDDPEAELLEMAQNAAQRSGNQGNLLSLFDGVFPTRKLFVLTVNNKYAVSSYLKNRPGRIFYMLTFTGLDENFIREYCEENLKPELLQFVDKVVSVSKTVDKFNFDMMKALIEEMNRYGETPRDAIRMLNINPDYNYRTVYHVRFYTPEGTEVPPSETDIQRWSGDPRLDMEIHGTHYRLIQGAGKTRQKQVEESYLFTQEDYHSFNVDTGEISFRNPKGQVMVLQQHKPKNYSERFGYEALLA